MIGPTTGAHTHHWIMVGAFYGLGQFLHILLIANAASRSSLNAFKTLQDYFRARWVPIVGRAFLSILAFILIWDNPKLVDLDSWLPGLAQEGALAGILGWFSDSVLDKVVNLLSGMFPGLQKELPVIPPNGGQ